MNEVNAQREVAQEISEIISSPSALGDVDEVSFLTINYQFRAYTLATG